MNFEDYAKEIIVGNPDHISIHRIYNDLNMLFTEGLNITAGNFASTSSSLINKDSYDGIVEQIRNHTHGQGNYLAFIDIPQELGFKMDDLNSVTAPSEGKSEIGFALPPKYILGYLTYDKWLFTPNPYYAFYKEDPNRVKSLEKAKTEMAKLQIFNKDGMNSVGETAFRLDNEGRSFDPNPLYKEMNDAVVNKGENDKIRISFNIERPGETNGTYSITSTNISNETQVLAGNSFNYDDIRTDIMDNIIRGMIGKDIGYNEDASFNAYILTNSKNVDLLLRNFPESDIARLRKLVIDTVVKNNNQSQAGGGRTYRLTGFANALILALIVGFECGIAFMILLNQINNR